MMRLKKVHFSRKRVAEKTRNSHVLYNFGLDWRKKHILLYKKKKNASFKSGTTIYQKENDGRTLFWSLHYDT
jgi:exoribonuclease II